MLHGAAHLHQIVEAGHILISLHEVAVGQFERAHLEFLNGVYAVFRTHGALQADALGIGLSVETAGIVEQILHRLRALHLIKHGALHIAGDLHQTIVGAHENDVAVGQMHIAGGVALDQVFIDVDSGNLLAVTKHADVAQRAQLVDAAGSIQRIEGGREAGEGVGAGTHDFAHHLYL